MRDGSASPVQGSPEPDALIMASSKAGVPGSIRIYTVAADGKSMIETATYFCRDGKPVMPTNYSNRIR